MKSRKYCVRGCLVSACLLFLSMGAPMVGAAWAGGQVSGRYLEARGAGIMLELKIKAPAPKSIIVIQQFASGTDIKKALPPYAKYDPASGRAKWLLKKVRPGKQLIHVYASSAVRPGSVSCTIRYRDPVSGAMIEKAVEPAP